MIHKLEQNQVFPVTTFSSLCLSHVEWNKWPSHSPFTQLPPCCSPREQRPETLSVVLMTSN